MGFGARFSLPGRVRRVGERPASPDVYPVNAGPTRFRASPSRATTHGVLHVPEPVTPVDGGRATPGKVRLVARTVRDPAVRYLFRIDGPDGVRETSPPMSPSSGSTQIEFIPDLDLREGGEYTWRVWVSRDGFAAPAAIATFRAGR